MERNLLAPPEPSRGTGNPTAMPLLFLFGACLLLLSCGEIRASHRVALGNYAYANGYYQKANLNYFKAQPPGGEKIVDYNLGTVFYALGEADSAQELWGGIKPGENRELAFRLVYNGGILNYRSGNYLAAYENFKSALLLKPSNLAAKINLEHSLSKINDREAGKQNTVSETASPISNSNEIQQVLEYIRRQEPIRPPREKTVSQSEGVRDW